MSLRKKLFILLILSCLILPLSVLAIKLNNPIIYNTFGELIEAIINFIYNVALVLAPLFIVIAGFYFVTAAGNPAQIETAKKIILYTLIGFLIILLARGLIAVIQSVFGVQVI